MAWISDSGGGREYNLQQFALPDFHFSFQLHATHWRTVHEGWTYPDHVHPLFELNLVLEGQQEMTIEGTEYIQNEGDLLIIRPDDMHCSRIGKASEVMSYFCLHLDIADNEFYQRLSNQLPLLHAADSELARKIRPFIDLLINLSKEHPENRTSDTFVIRTAALNILLVLSDLCARAGELVRPDKPHVREYAADVVQKLRERNELERKVRDFFNESGHTQLLTDDYVFPHHRWVGVFSLMIPDRQFWTKPERFWAKSMLLNALSELGSIVITEGDQLMTAVTFSNTFTVPPLEEYAVKSKSLLENSLGTEIRLGFGGITAAVGELRSLYRQSLRQLGQLKPEEETGADCEFIGRVIRTAMNYIESEYGNPELSLGYLAKRLHLTPNYLSSLFSSETGCTFTQHLSRIRIDQAKLLLQQSNLKVYEISKQVGYADQAYFSRLFKSEVGQSPNRYRVSKLKKQE